MAREKGAESKKDARQSRAVGTRIVMKGEMGISSGIVQRRRERRLEVQRAICLSVRGGINIETSDVYISTQPDIAEN